MRQAEESTLEMPAVQGDLKGFFGFGFGLSMRGTKNVLRLFLDSVTMVRSYDMWVELGRLELWRLRLIFALITIPCTFLVIINNLFMLLYLPMYRPVD